MTVISSFGKKLRAMRLAFDLRQIDVEFLSREIANRLGCPDFIVSNSRLSTIEHDRALPGPAKLLTLAAVYGLTVSQLMTLWAAIKPRGGSREAGRGPSDGRSLEGPDTFRATSCHDDPGAGSRALLPIFTKGLPAGKWHRRERSERRNQIQPDEPSVVNDKQNAMDDPSKFLVSEKQNAV